MDLFRKARKEDFVVVSISSDLTMDVDNNSVMVSAIEACKPSYWQMRNPDGYTVFLRSSESDSRGRAETLLGRVQSLILTDGRFANFRIGLAEGPLLVQINWRGKVCSPPFGGAVSTACQNQKGRQDFQSQPPDRTL